MKAILVLTSTNPFFEEELKSLCEACHIEIGDVVIQKLEKIKNGDIIVLSGSVSKGIENNIYEEICKKIKEKEKRDNCYYLFPHLCFKVAPCSS